MKQQGLQPDKVTYGAVLQAITRQEGSANVALELLNELRNEYNFDNHKPKPDAIKFTTVISILRQSGTLFKHNNY